MFRLLVLSLVLVLSGCFTDVESVKRDLREQFQEDLDRAVAEVLDGLPPSVDTSRYCTLEEYSQGLLTTCGDGRQLVCIPTEAPAYYSCQMVGLVP